MRLRRPIGAAALCCGLAAAAAASGGGDADGAAAAQARPNVIVIMTDDQTATEQSRMRRVARRIGGRGASFPDSITNLALCCPSRATLLTGQYAHNHRVRGNAPPEGGYTTLDHENTLPVWLQDAGYYTAHIGKYMNGYEQQPQPTSPPGWSSWNGSTETYRYYGFELNLDGVLTPYAPTAANYQTDVYTERAVDVIADRAPSPQPFFMWLSYTAPHEGGPDPSPHGPSDCQGGPQPAPRHGAAFDRARLPRPPSFDEANIADKPSWLQARERFDADDVAWVRGLFRCRIESTQAVDEGVGEVLKALSQAGELDETYVIYTSDNGFMLGEHRMRQGKDNVYEPAIRVPLMIRGPGIPVGVRVREQVTNADLAPTIVDVTGAEPGLAMDGRSLMSLARNPRDERGRDLLIQAWHRNADVDRNAFGVRNRRFKFVVYENGERELYDLARDPHELRNVAGVPAYRESQLALAKRLRALRGCDGAECLRLPGAELSLRGPRPSDRSCARKSLRALISGSDAESVDRVAFEAPGRRAIDLRSPFALRIPTKARRRDGTVRAVADLIDGRRVRLAKGFRACAQR